jgi:hypothetical protein
LLVKEETFKRTKTPEKMTPSKKLGSDKENYVTPTLQSLSSSINNSKQSNLPALYSSIENQEVRSPDSRHGQDFNIKSTQSSAFKDYDDRNSLSSHEDKVQLLKQERKSTPLLPKSQNRPQSSTTNSSIIQRLRQPSKTPERTLTKFGSNKKPVQELKSPPNEPSIEGEYIRKRLI